MGLEMTSSTINPFGNKPRFLPKQRLCFAIFVIIPIIYLIGVQNSSLLIPIALSQRFIGSKVVSITSSNKSASSSPSLVTPITYSREEILNKSISCDYSSGKWIPSDLGPLYNGTSCMVQNENNCLSNGRPDTGYLYWRWKPFGDECELPRFDPEAFLTLMRGKHLAFVGDSLSRNQEMSLTCMLSSLYHPTPTYFRGGQAHDNGLHVRWHFSSHNVNISYYWSPYLLNGTSNENRTIYMDAVDETWASDLGMIDVLVLSIGNWFTLPFVIYEGGLEVGCHACHGPNQTEIEMGVAFRKVLSNAFKPIYQMKASYNDDHADRKSIDVIVITYPPNHFEGVWFLGAGCPKTEPYEESKEMESLFEQMRKIGVEAVEEARSIVMDMGIQDMVRIKTLDITKLSWLRPDAHPGIYVLPQQYVNHRTNNKSTLVVKDCLHWCLPGAIDTWNEIMFEIIKNWHSK